MGLPAMYPLSPPPATGYPWLGLIRAVTIVTDQKDSVLKEESGNTLQVPVELRQSFEANINDSLRDLAGESVVGKYKLITARDRIHQAASRAQCRSLHPSQIMPIPGDE